MIKFVRDQRGERERGVVGIVSKALFKTALSIDGLDGSVTVSCAHFVGTAA